MRFYDLTFGLYIILIVCSGCAIAMGNYMFDEFWPDDNAAEEYVEERIKDKTGIDVDLTPNSEEKPSSCTKKYKKLSSLK